MQSDDEILAGIAAATAARRELYDHRAAQLALLSVELPTLERIQRWMQLLWDKLGGPDGVTCFSPAMLEAVRAFLGSQDSSDRNTHVLRMHAAGGYSSLAVLERKQLIESVEAVMGLLRVEPDLAVAEPVLNKHLNQLAHLAVYSPEPFR